MSAWDTTAPKDEYSVENFYTRATDKRGHKVDRRIATSTDLDGQLATLVASRQYPAYTTVGDIYRDGVVHRLRQLDEMDGLPPALQEMLELRIARDQAEQVIERIDRQEAAVEMCKRALERAKKTKIGLTAAIEAARKVLPQVEGTLREELEAALK